MSRKNTKTIQLVEPELLLSKSIAIVGSSSKILKENYGEFIDSYDDVIRFNRSITKNYEINVGSKTTLRVVNNHVFDNLDIRNKGFTNSPKNFVKKLRNSSILFIGPDEGPWNRRNKNSHKSNKLFKFDYLKLYEVKNVLDIDNDRNLQIGTIVIGLCILSDIKPHIFGFDLNNEKRTHYFESRPESSSHDAHAETAALRRLVNKGLILCD